ncbi:MAG: PadR family transcriptional regulator [Eubacteriaceae bacterium]|nr:PadR family transcriptional regulator [Eubacteriaceae bacterium]
MEDKTVALTEATYYILLSLYRPRHGYGIMQQSQTLSRGRVNLAAGTLYGALNTMCEKEWISPIPIKDNSRKKEYMLTDLGLSVLKKELERLKELVDAGESILGGDNND